MNTFLGPEQLELKSSFDQFVAETVLPDVEILDNVKVSAADYLRKFGQKGFLGLAVPTEYGGLGKGLLELGLFIESLGACEPGLASAVTAHCSVIELIARYGTEKQKSRYLPLLARGECLAGIALAEEDAGSDIAAITSIIEITKEKARLVASKARVVNGAFADLICLLARAQDTDSGQADNPEASLSFWLVDMDSARSSGTLQIVSRPVNLGLRSAATCDLKFSAFELSLDARLGDDVSMQAVEYVMSFAAVLVAFTATGLLESAIDCSVERANSRKQFGANIGRYQAIQWKLADMSTEYSSARLLSMRAAWAHESAPENFKAYAAMCKFFAARAARVHSAETVQIFGALGLEQGSASEKMYRDAKVMEIYEGTSEIQKNIIAEELRIGRS